MMNSENKITAFEREMTAILYSLGELKQFFEIDTITDIFVNDGIVSVKEFGKDRRKTDLVLTNQQCINILTQIAKFISQDIDYNKYPVLEGTIPHYDARITAILKWTKNPFITIRKKPKYVYKLEDYVKNGQCSQTYADKIENFIKFKKNILVSGGTGSGKTTFTNCLIAKIAEYYPNESFYIVEDTPELQCTAQFAQILTIDTEDAFKAVRLALRCSPDRIIFGELREGKVLWALLDAWNTGHPGGIATIHSESAEGTFLRMKTLLSQEFKNEMPIKDLVDVIIHLSKIPGKGIMIDEIIETKDYMNNISEIAKNSVEQKN